MLRSSKQAIAMRALSLVIGSAAIGGCTLATDVTVPGGLIKVSGDEQTAPANTALTTPLTVAVVNQFGQTLQNVTVNWIISSGGGSLSSTAMLSDEGGLASVTYTTGPTAGQAVIKARVNGVPDLAFNILIT